MRVKCLPRQKDIRQRQQRWWDVVAERPRGFEVNDKLEARWLPEWQAAQLRVFENAISEGGHAAEPSSKSGQ
jgi:hypothetical protein